ncbi:TniB family NTP-binding protein [Endozoicomonas sp. ALB032]|uniref:TniB family NTP-binding protein n=1 Tax=Endozoicomonas sp. ALB032 TaxID=3403082 RepID=UPI003BB762BC
MSDHLQPSVREVLEQPIEKQIKFVRSPGWIGYDSATQVLAKLNELLDWPQCHRMPNLLIVGETNNGKSILLTRFCEEHPPYYKDPEAFEGFTLPALLVQCPPVPDERMLYNAILDTVWAPRNVNDSATKLLGIVLRTLKHANVRMLILDELHHMLAGTTKKQHQFLNTIKYLANELRIPIVAAGLKEAVRAISVEPQLSNRFSVVSLPTWQLDRPFLRLLASFERVLPLVKPSNLTSKEFATTLYTASEGLIGELSMILSEATVRAVKAGRSHITPKDVESIGWVPPSERQKHASTI